MHINFGVIWSAAAVVSAIFVPIGIGTFKWLARITRAVDRLESGQVEMKTDVQEIRAEFPKNGIPTRAVIDAIKADLIEVKTSAIELKTSHEAHLTMLHGQRAK